MKLCGRRIIMPFKPGENKMSQAAFEAKVLAVHEGRLKVLGTYTHTHSKIAMQCNDCGHLFEAKPNNLTIGKSGCKACYLRAKTPSQEEFEQRVHEASCGALTVVGKYVKNNQPIEIKCNTCNRLFLATAVNLVVGKMGCAACASYGFDPTKSAIMYYLKILGGQAYKIGITNGTIKTRFSRRERDIMEVLKVWHFPLGLDARDKEQEVLQLHKQHKYTGPALLTNGNTELFSIDVLGLDRE